MQLAGRTLWRDASLHHWLWGMGRRNGGLVVCCHACTGTGCGCSINWHPKARTRTSTRTSTSIRTSTSAAAAGGHGSQSNPRHYGYQRTSA